MSGETYIGSRAPEIAALVDRGTALSRALESRERTADVLARNLGAITEQDWRDALERCDARLAALLD